MTFEEIKKELAEYDDTQLRAAAQKLLYSPLPEWLRQEALEQTGIYIEPGKTGLEVLRERFQNKI